MSLHRRLLLAAALFAPAAVLAQQQQQPADPAAASDVVVLGTGLTLPPGMPAYGSVLLDRSRLTGDASGRVEDVLADVAGVQQFRRSDSRSANPSAQGLTVRSLGGNATSRSLWLLDGVPIADPFFGSIPFTALSPERLGAVRITRGGGSGPFGAGAVAGTVELVSAGRADLPPVAAEAAYGSFASSRVAASVSPDIGAGYATLFGRFERSDGFQTTPVDQRVAATALARYRDGSAGFRAVAPIDADSELQAAGLVFDDHRTLRFRGADSSSRGEDASIRLIRRAGSDKSWQVDHLSAEPRPAQHALDRHRRQDRAAAAGRRRPSAAHRHRHAPCRGRAVRGRLWRHRPGHRAPQRGRRRDHERRLRRGRLDARLRARRPPPGR